MVEISPDEKVTPIKKEAPPEQMPEISVSPADSFLLFRDSGQYIMHLGPENRDELNTGGFLVSFCVWAMNQQTAIDEFKAYLTACMNDPEVVDEVIEKVSNESTKS